MSDALSPDEDEVLSFIRNLMDKPAVQRMVELDNWGREQGLDSDHRAALVAAISALMVSSSNIEVVKEYVKRVVDVVADLGPSLVGSKAEEKG